MEQAKETSRGNRQIGIVGTIAAWPFRRRSKQPQSFRFLDLPRELRDEIYHIALMHPAEPMSPRLPADVVSQWDHPRAHELYFGLKPERKWLFFRKDDRAYHKAYWGTERATRLFRVNRQVSEESLQIFYSRFKFLVECGTQPEWLFPRLLHRILPLSTMALIKNIEFSVLFDTVPSDSPDFDILTCWWTDSQIEHAVDEVACLLPRFAEGQGRLCVSTKIFLSSGPLTPTSETTAVKLVAGRLEKWTKLGGLTITQKLDFDEGPQPFRMWERSMERLGRVPYPDGMRPEAPADRDKPPDKIYYRFMGMDFGPYDLDIRQ